MGWPQCNSTVENETIHEVELWDGGLTFHTLCLIAGGAFALTGACISFFLIMCHATHYSKPTEQRHVIRILLMIPVYSLVSWLGTYYYKKSVYFSVLGDCYEAFTIAAFFALLCHYIAPDLHSQKDYFRGIEPKPWVWPMNWLQKVWGGEHGIWRTPRSGLTWFNVVWVGVFQYCLLRVLMTIAAVLSQKGNVYCEETLNPKFAHIWVMAVECIAVSIAMYCLIQFYIQVKDDISQHRPFLKILSIKLVIFLSFWQGIMISFLFSAGAIKATKKLHASDLKVGLPNFLVSMEMAIFAVLHLWSFAWQPYSLQNPHPAEVTDFYGNGKATYQGGRFGLRALGDTFNPMDLIRSVARSLRWLFVGRKRRTMDPSYQTSSEGIGLSSNGGVPITTAGAGASIAGGRRTTTTGRYGTSPDDEDDGLLSHAQPNPASHSPTDTMMPPGYEETDSRFYNHNRLSAISLLEPGMHSPQPYSPYEDRFHNPYMNMMPEESALDHSPVDQHPNSQLPSQNLTSHNHPPAITINTNTTPYPSDELQEQAPIPLPDSYRPPPQHHDSDPYIQRYPHS
ncbi:uncharacterized protein LDX57_008149 [Aspergillus melleus]|uniref:uncharacterized protein n=1 Tax=Aspergillus melleus TaxID=138277 RepID=UPI001E8D3C2F|nr:uncharacterized protein LDX57_008149 [Aspergillus melleus]KAH8430487.1 hypothetical protein LDX57_008149 [Aspergillus melleus]